MPLIKFLLIAKRPSSVDHRPGLQYYFKTSLKKVKYITKFTIQDICIVISSCANPPGNIEAFCHIVHYHYRRQGLETPCVVCFCLFLSNRLTSQIAGGLKLLLSPMSRMDIKLLPTSARSPALMNREKGLS